MMKGEQYNKCIGNVKYTSIEQLNSLWTLWDLESIRNCQNTLKQYFQCICRCPDLLEDLS